MGSVMSSVMSQCVTIETPVSKLIPRPSAPRGGGGVMLEDPKGDETPKQLSDATTWRSLGC